MSISGHDSPRNIVKKTIEFSNPERVAHTFGDSDIVFADHQVKTPATDWSRTAGSRWERTDEWGNTWFRIDDTSKGEVLKGALSEPDEISGYGLPDFSQPGDYSAAAAEFEMAVGKYRAGNVPGFTFNIARKVFKLEDYLVFLLTDLDKIRRLHDKIDTTVADMIINYGKAGADAIFFTEDWGTQTQTMINPVLWREEFYPRTKRLCEIAHSRGMKVFMHSCGAISAIIPGLIEAGIDCLQFDQPTLHGIDKLASFQELGKITYWCPVDIQRTLQSGDESLIRGEAVELIQKLWRGRGGFIAGFYPDEPSIGLETKWQEIASDEFNRQGVASRF